MIKYAFQKDEENIAKAYGRSLSISAKMSKEICDNIKGKPLKKATELLERVIKKESAIKIKTYGRDTAHKKEIGPGKYPINASKEILRILKSAASNAQNKGLDEKNLYIEHISVHKAPTSWHYGRKRRSKMKRAHVQVVLKEKKVSLKEDKK
jgi:large subunit ribosomal protein L22